MTRVEVEPVLLMYAFRYALGRKTYAVGDVADALIEHRDALRPEWREQIVENIAEAIDADDAGMTVDIVRWEQVAEALA